MTKLNFSGHESFECRHFWLKKGYDHVNQGLKFNDEAVVTLGVGKNMVASIRYWMKAYGLLDKNENLTEFAKVMFSDEGFDPYLEDEASLWLLHYNIIIQAHASIYTLVFNDFRRGKPEFTKENLLAFVKTKQQDVNENTFSKDFDSFIRTYIPKQDDVEENYEGVLTELHLIMETKKEKKSVFVIDTIDRDTIPAHVLLYCILNTHSGNSISFETLFSDRNSIGVIFAFTKEGLANKLEEIADVFKKEGIVFSDHAGIKELQFKKKQISPLKALKQYYQSSHVN